MDNTELAVAILAGPVTAGLVAAIGIFEQRREARDLEVRRKNLVSSARDQLSAIQIWESMKAAQDGYPAEFSRKAESIIASALESLSQAQAMRQPEGVPRQNRVGEMWLIGSIDTAGGKLLRGVYYVAFTWTISLFVLAVLVAGLPPYVNPLGNFFGLVLIGVATGLVPALFFRWAALAYDRHRRSTPSHHSGDSEQPPPAPIRPAPFPYQPPPGSAAGWYPPPMPGAGGVRRGSP
ncbi:hypothetical protein [Nocardia niwae]|uniref:DUF4239 domain-containing protein n=1 Tax=Nocardia niwae TaxID=626084 RepID=A0ABV2X4G2_9NOCA